MLFEDVSGITGEHSLKCLRENKINESNIFVQKQQKIQNNKQFRNQVSSLYGIQIVIGLNKINKKELNYIIKDAKSIFKTLILCKYVFQNL